MNKTEFEEHRSEAKHRSNIYGLLATVYRQEITPDLLQQIKAPLGMFVRHFLSSADMR